ncbi:MAG: magnesium chelatase subunit H [Pikeienuella sp.]
MARELRDAAQAPGLSGDRVAPRVVLVTLDRHLAGSLARVSPALEAEIPGIEVVLHAASEWADDPAALEAARADIAAADIIVATMIFLDDQVQAILPALKARQEDADALVCCISAAEIVKLTRIGGLAMDKPAKGIVGLLKKLRGKPKTGGQASSGAGQKKLLRRLPKILRFIPGKAQDLRAYFLTMQYYLSGSDENLANLVRFLVDRYASGPRAWLRGKLDPQPPVDYPETGVYHPEMAERLSESPADLPRQRGARGRVGLLLMRSYILAGDTAHYDRMIASLEERGLDVVPAFAAGLDARPAVDAFFRGPDGATVDAVLSLTGFSLVGGPAYNDAAAAGEVLAGLDVPYLAAHALEFQSLETWAGSSAGLSPVEATMMVAIPEIDGATGPTVFGGRAGGGVCSGCALGCRFDPDGAGQGGPRAKMVACPERVGRLADRVAKLVELRSTPRAERRLAIVLFGFPPNAGAIGTAAYLSVFESLHGLLGRLRDEGYQVTVPDSVDALREAVLGGGPGTPGAHGQEAAIAARISADDIVRDTPWLDEIEAVWGPAPGRQQSNGREVFVLGAQFGEVFVGVQPAFGYEGDPMRLLFEGGFAPTHAFVAFYRWLRESFGAHALLHFGTHGALEFMPGKQVGLSQGCWPDRLIGDMPNIYYYAANNPSEGALAKRRAAATTVTYLTPPLAQAGLYKGLADLKASIDRWRAAPPEAAEERAQLAELIQAQAAELDMAVAEPAWQRAGAAEIPRLAAEVTQLEQTLIPHGLHVLGRIPSLEERTDTLAAMAGAVAEAEGVAPPPLPALRALAEGQGAELAGSLAGLAASDGSVRVLARLERAAVHLGEDSETPALVHALDGGFIAPVAGGDLIRSPEILPTGRNLHGHDPYRMPSAFALRDGAVQADRLLDAHRRAHGQLPSSIALVLWGTDNLKSEGGPIAQALAFMGARPRFDGYGRLCGAELIPLEVLGRPRIDVVMTLSGIFRDLLPLQAKLLAEAAWLAATAEEPLAQNHIRANALAHQAAQGCDLETAALRVFSNAEGAYGANVNQLIDAGSWGDEDELADAYEKRKCFAYCRNGKARREGALLSSIFSKVDLAYQNLESVELGVTTIDHYFDTLGGISRAVSRAKGADAPVYIGDQTRGGGTVRTLQEQVALETRTRALNPKWFEGMLEHGHEGVRNIEAQVTNTLGWSATTGAVDPWVYQRLSETYLLDPEMRRRLAALNPAASARLANRLIEAHERQYWTPDADTLAALTASAEELEDRLEGIDPGPAIAAA